VNYPVQKYLGSANIGELEREAEFLDIGTSKKTKIHGVGGFGILLAIVVAVIVAVGILFAVEYF
jgi:hypothetical protein